MGELAKRDILLEKIKGSKALAEDFAHYKRMPQNGPDKTFKFLWEYMDRHLAVEHQEQQMADLKASCKKGVMPALAAELVSSNYQFGDLRLQYLPPENDRGEPITK